MVWSCRRGGRGSAQPPIAIAAGLVLSHDGLSRGTRDLSRRSRDVVAVLRTASVPERKKEYDLAGLLVAGLVILVVFVLNLGG